MHIKSGKDSDHKLTSNRNIMSMLEFSVVNFYGKNIFLGKFSNAKTFFSNILTKTWRAGGSVNYAPSKQFDHSTERRLKKPSGHT